MKHGMAFPVPFVPTYEGEGEGDAEGNDDVNLEDPKIKAAIDAAASSQLAGLKKNRDDIKGEKDALVTKVKELEATWSGLDPVAVKGLMDRMANDEDTRLIAEGNIDEVITRRTDALRNDAQTRIEAAEAKVGELTDSLTAKDRKIAGMVIGGAVRSAAALAKVLPEAVPDVERRAREIFSLGENDVIEARTPDGTLIIGKDGSSSLSPEDWLADSMRKDAPHWWGPSGGGGAGGGKDPAGGHDKNEDLSKLTGPQLLTRGVSRAGQGS